MLQYLSAIRRLELLQDFSDDEIYRGLFDSRFGIKRYGEGGMVHFSGERCDRLQIILEGKVSVERIDEAGNLMVISEFGRDDILGGNLLFSSNPYYPLMISAREVTTILEIDKETLFGMFLANASFLRRYLGYISDHASILTDKIKNHVNLTIRQSVMNFLEYERQRQQTDCIRLNMTKKEMAEKIGVQRTSLQRELAKMRDDGLIRFDPVEIILL